MRTYGSISPEDRARTGTAGSQCSSMFNIMAKEFAALGTEGEAVLNGRRACMDGFVYPQVLCMTCTGAE